MGVRHSCIVDYSHMVGRRTVVHCNVALHLATILRIYDCTSNPNMGAEIQKVSNSLTHSKRDRILTLFAIHQCYPRPLGSSGPESKLRKELRSN